jgi:hypothetical protein
MDMSKTIDVKSKQQTYTLPSVAEQWTKNVCMIKTEKTRLVKDSEDKEVTETYIESKTLTDKEDNSMRLSEAKAYYDQIMKQRVTKITPEDLEKITALVDTYLPNKETVKSEELETELKRNAKWGCSCANCGRFYMFKAKPTLDGFNCENSVNMIEVDPRADSTVKAVIFCDRCGAKINLSTIPTEEA